MIENSKTELILFRLYAMCCIARRRLAPNGPLIEGGVAEWMIRSRRTQTRRTTRRRLSTGVRRCGNGRAIMPRYNSCCVHFARFSFCLLFSNPNLTTHNTSRVHQASVDDGEGVFGTDDGILEDIELGGYFPENNL